MRVHDVARRLLRATVAAEAKNDLVERRVQGHDGFEPRSGRGCGQLRVTSCIVDSWQGAI